MISQLLYWCIVWWRQVCNMPSSSSYLFSENYVLVPQGFSVYQYSSGTCPRLWISYPGLTSLNASFFAFVCIKFHLLFLYSLSQLIKSGHLYCTSFGTHIKLASHWDSMLHTNQRKKLMNRGRAWKAANAVGINSKGSVTKEDQSKEKSNLWAEIWHVSQKRHCGPKGQFLYTTVFFNVLKGDEKSMECQ